MPDDGSLEDILTTPPQEVEEAQGEAVNTEATSQADPNSQQQAGQTQGEPAASSLPESLVSRAKAAGLQLDGINDPNRLAELFLDRYVQEKVYADYGRQSLSRPYDKVLEKAQDPVNEKPREDAFNEEEHFGGLWKVGELDEACKYAIQQGIVTLGEDGVFQAKPGFENMALPLLQAINQSHLSQKEHVGRLFEGNFYQNVDKGLWPAYEARLNKILDERLNNRFQTYEQQTSENGFIDKFCEDNKAWLYDATGQGLSPEGLKFQAAVQELRENGINNPQLLANYAIKIAGINTNAGSPPVNPAGSGVAAQPAPNSERPRDEQGRFLPPGKAAPVTPQKSKQESFLDKARRHATNSDSRSGGGLNSGADYQVSNEADLENMFTDAWRHAAVV